MTLTVSPASATIPGEDVMGVGCMVVAGGGTRSGIGVGVKVATGAAVDTGVELVHPATKITTINIKIRVKKVILRISY
jgi:hypothetical protein